MAIQALAISKTGMALIQRFEGFRAEPALLPDGRYVVGYGHLQTTPAAVTKAEAQAALEQDLAPVAALLNQVLLAPVSQNQFDALASFAFSIGLDAFKRSDVVRHLNAGEPIAAACAFDAWRKSDALGDAQVIDVLVRRRAAEKALFLEVDTPPAAPSVFLRPMIDHASAILSAAPIVAAPDLDAPVAVADAPAVDEIAERLADILASEPATAPVLAPRVDDRVDDDVLVLDTPLSDTDSLVAAPMAEAAPLAPSTAPVMRSQPQPHVRRSPDVGERRAFLLLALAGLTLIALGAWALFATANQTAFLMLSAPGVVVTGMAGYYLARAMSPRRGQELPTPAPAG